jgi:hypothetical protein
MGRHTVVIRTSAGRPRPCTGDLIATTTDVAVPRDLDTTVAVAVTIDGQRSTLPPHQ